MTTTIKNTIYAVGIVLMLFSAYFAHGFISFRSTTPEFSSYQVHTLLSATTTTATSTTPNGGGVATTTGAKKATVYFTRDSGSGGNAGTSTFSIQVTPDGTNWYNYNKLISNVTNTNAQTLTRVSSVNIVAATSTTLVAMDFQDDAFLALRCVALINTDGANTCKIAVEY
jgi:hypothetical protein